MYHADQGAAFAAQALTGLHAGAGLPAVDPGATSPADEAAWGGGFVPEANGNGDQGVQGATQGTQDVAPAAAQAAVQPYKAGEEMSMAIHQDLDFPNGTATYSDMEIAQRLTDRLPIAERLAVTPTRNSGRCAGKIGGSVFKKVQARGNRKYYVPITPSLG